LGAGKICEASLHAGVESFLNRKMYLYCIFSHDGCPPRPVPGIDNNRLHYPSRSLPHPISGAKPSKPVTRHNPRQGHPNSTITRLGLLSIHWIRGHPLQFGIHSPRQQKAAHPSGPSDDRSQSDTVAAGHTTEATLPKGSFRRGSEAAALAAPGGGGRERPHDTNYPSCEFTRFQTGIVTTVLGADVTHNRRVQVSGRVCKSQNRCVGTERPTCDQRRQVSHRDMRIVVKRI
jgi:hypothetical protein